jgi:hypothetical protein
VSALTQSQWKEFEDAGEFPPDDAVDETVRDLFAALNRTNHALKAVLRNKSVRDADEIISDNERILS